MCMNDALPIPQRFPVIPSHCSPQKQLWVVADPSNVEEDIAGELKGWGNWRKLAVPAATTEVSAAHGRSN